MTSPDPGSRDERTARQLVDLSRWINAGSPHRDPEAVLWSRVLKVSEETGEVYAALSGAIGENPRKGVTHTMDDVVAELLDVASAALCAVEHLTDHGGQALALLADRVERTAARAAATSAAAVEPTTAGGEADDGTTPDADLQAWKPNTNGTGAPWREGDCAGHEPDGHRTRWCYCRRNALRYPARRPAPSVTPDSDQLRDEVEECSATCVQRICEWCPGQDRFEAVAQWLYKAVIARQDRIPTDDVTPWSDLTKDQRNGWRGWANELLDLTDGPLQQLRREHAERGEELRALVEAVGRGDHVLAPAYRRALAYVRAPDGS